MPYLVASLGLFTVGLVVHGVVTGTLQIKGGIHRASHPTAFWCCCACFVAVGSYLCWLAWYDFWR